MSTLTSKWLKNLQKKIVILLHNCSILNSENSCILSNYKATNNVDLQDKQVPKDDSAQTMTHAHYGIFYFKRMEQENNRTTHMLFSPHMKLHSLLKSKWVRIDWCSITSYKTRILPEPIKTTEIYNTISISSWDQATYLLKVVSLCHLCKQDKTNLSSVKAIFRLEACLAWSLNGITVNYNQ